MAFPTDTSASDVWSLKDQYIAEAGGNWPPLILPVLVDYLVVAGGGGGAGGWSGTGGGAGGLLSTQGVTLSAGISYTVTVGAGGANGKPGVQGGSSEFNSQTAIGGGGGGYYSTQQLGGSGGSGAGSWGTALGGAGTAGQGNDGGYNTTLTSSAYATGGGGGAGSVGGNAFGDTNAGNGGDGLASSITGSSVTYAGGGGGNAYYGATTADNIGIGGSGGGGDGGSFNSGNASIEAESGTANTGGGGGGQRTNGYNGGDGGSGVVIIRTLSTISEATGSPTLTTDGNYNIYTFTGSGSITFGPTPALVTSGLVTYLDARNSSSYPGSGTTWTDLSGNSIDGTLNSDVSYSNGALVFSTGIPTVFLPANSIDTNSDFTQTFINEPNASAQTILTLASGTNAGSLQIRYNNGAIQLVRSKQADMGTFSGFTANDGQFYNITVSRSGDVYSLYVDGVFISTLTRSDTLTIDSPIIGDNNYLSGSERFNGNMYACVYYNRALTSSEIYDNYLALL